MGKIARLAFSDDSKHWNGQKTLSYNCLYNFIIGIRNAGKTFGGNALMLDRFLTGKGKTMYLRRYSTELDDLTHGPMPSMFVKLNRFLKKHGIDAECTAKDDMLYCGDALMGYARALTTISNKKSNDFDNVSLIIMDEFIIENKATYHYLKNEVNVFNSVYKTIVRDIDRFVPVLFLSNAVSIANPYFDFYHLSRPFNNGDETDVDRQRFGNGRHILVEDVHPRKLQEETRKTAWYEMNMGTDYADYAVNNTWLLDNTDFIAKKNKRCVYKMSLRYNGRWLGVWFDPLDWLYYISEDVDLTHPMKYSATTDDHKPNVLLFHGAQQMPFIKEIRDAYDRGCVRYESMRLKNDFRDIIRMSRR